VGHGRCVDCTAQAVSVDMMVWNMPCWGRYLCGDHVSRLKGARLGGISRTLRGGVESVREQPAITPDQVFCGRGRARAKQ
jgi:hypothetical protein